MSDWVGVVLAAGEGRRMNSKIPKVLHQVCGKPDDFPRRWKD